jgi:RND family efflux transporter MFP subunit
MSQADVSSKTLGVLDAVLVDRGDKVKRDQLIALVRPSDLPDQLEAARGTLQQAKASVALARTNLARAKQLAPSGVVSDQELQQASAALQQADAAEVAAQAQISSLATRIGETRITSPLDGFVSVRKLDPGALVGPANGAIVTVVRYDILRVFITVNERDAQGVTIGKDAHIEVDALPNHKPFWGKVVRLAPAFDATTRTLEAEVQIPNTEGELRPGMYGRGSIVVETHPGAPVVPAVAVQLSERKAYVFVVDGDKVARRPIELGVDLGNSFEVRKGLAPGDRVVTAGADGIADGVQVRVSNLDPFTGRPTAGTNTTTVSRN